MTIDRTFFDRPVLQVAPDLLGCVVSHRSAAGTVSVRLCEVEAYAGADDPGSHAYRGQRPGNAVMFGPGGFVYVYFTYGMHWCINLVCGPTGRATAVLLRAGEVVAGHDVARQRRGPCADRDLARGPARLCKSLGIGAAANGLDALATDGVITVQYGSPPAAPGSSARRARQPAEPAAQVIATGPRVGLRQAADRPWRFWVRADPTVSPYRPHPSLRGHAVVPGTPAEDR